MTQNGRPPIAFETAAEALAETVRHCHARGWALATSGNFSVVLEREPLRLAITRSGVDKGRVGAAEILEIDAGGRVLSGEGRPSAETALHLTIVPMRGAGAVLHTHSVWSTLLSEAFAETGGLRIHGLEMLKSLRGVTTHEHSEWLPIVENAQDMTALGAAVRETLERHPDCHGFLLRGHGLYTWGEDLAEARRHVEGLEFLMEVIGRTQAAATLGSEPAPARVAPQTL